jgi:hypothetical protein
MHSNMVYFLSLEAQQTRPISNVPLPKLRELIQNVAVVFNFKPQIYSFFGLNRYFATAPSSLSYILIQGGSLRDVVYLFLADP